MSETSIEACANWFRQGVVDKLGHAKTRRLPPGTHWSAESAYEAGVTLGKQMLCEKTGHDDEDREWSYADGAKSRYVRHKDRTCRLCGREERITVASFNDREQWEAYHDRLFKERQEAK